jgi:hypothetical protein
MHKSIKFISGVWKDGREYLAAPLYTLIILFCLASFCLTQQGCGTTPKVLSTEQRLYQTGTNIVAEAKTEPAPHGHRPYSIGGMDLARCGLSSL